MDKNNPNSSFWNTQPVGICDGNGNIEKPIKIRTEPYTLPDGFKFDNITDVKELSKLLQENYVEDPNEEFRLLYSEKFLSWILSHPTHKEEYSLGLRFNGVLVGYVFGKETTFSLSNDAKIAAINFLCISRDLRKKRIAPVLIKEMTRRFNCNGIYQGIFTAGTDLFFNICTSRYYHKPLNNKKLLSSGFISQEYDINTKAIRESSRPCTVEDIPEMYKIYCEYIEKFKLVEIMSFEDFKHNLYNDIVKTIVYVEKDKICSFGSYYVLETLSIKNNIKIKGAFLNITCGTKIKEMVEDLIAHANSEKCDVFNCLNIGENEKFLEELEFKEGSGELKYYLYNWKSSTMQCSDIYFYFY